MTDVSVRLFLDADTAWAESLLERTLGGRWQARRGELLDVLDLAGLVALADARPVGLLIYQVIGDACELVAIAASERHVGVGTALLDALVEVASGCERIWLITTNDNLDALRFYQRRGFVLRAIYPDALIDSRKLKPRIPKVGAYGIPLRDELELEFRLEGCRSGLSGPS